MSNPSKGKKRRPASLSSDDVDWEFDVFRSPSPEHPERRSWIPLRVIDDHFDLYKGKKYHIEWKNGQCTWERNRDQLAEIIQNWEDERKAKKKLIAERSTEVDVSSLFCLPHEVLTRLDREAYSEKKQLLAEQSSRPKSGSKTDESATRERTRRSIQKQIDRETALFGAAPIRIVYPDDKANAPLASSFLYYERDYIYSNKVYIIDSTDFLEACTPRGKCSAECVCQRDSQFTRRDKKTLAYDEKGRFKLSKLSATDDIIECNEKCQCGPDCQNRVTQRPRTIPLEIFKTKNTGWGVRATCDIERGTVIGLCTGKVMTRKEADALGDDNSIREYLLDLDNHDSDPNVMGLYTLDTRAQGNWTRFLNHSCGPNTQTVNVYQNTTLQQNIPRIAVVATATIPAREELTFDYSPGSQRELEEARQQGKTLVGHMPCSCDRVNCRNFIYYVDGADEDENMEDLYE